MMEFIRLGDIEGIAIGHDHNLEAATGCTVIICANGAVAGVDVRGGAPGTRETDLLNPVNMIEKVHAVLLAGGSAFGLDAATGVMNFLEEKGIGFDVGLTKVPIVPGAVLFDLAIGSFNIRPDKEMGYRAANSASPGEDRQGNIGAGAGATVGKYYGFPRSMKSGLGTCCVRAGQLKVGAIVVVNCFGDVIDPETGKIIAGTLSDNRKEFANTEKEMIANYDNINNAFAENTTIGAVITNANLTKAQASKIASMSQNGFARTIRPAHTMYDGDTIFTMATGETYADVNTVGLLATKMMETAVINAVKKAESLHGLKSYNDF